MNRLLLGTVKMDEIRDNISKLMHQPDSAQLVGDYEGLLKLPDLNRHEKEAVYNHLYWCYQAKYGTCFQSEKTMKLLTEYEQYLLASGDTKSACEMLTGNLQINSESGEKNANLLLLANTVLDKITAKDRDPKIGSFVANGGYLAQRSGNSSLAVRFLNRYIQGWPKGQEIGEVKLALAIAKHGKEESVTDSEWTDALRSAATPLQRGQLLNRYQVVLLDRQTPEAHAQLRKVTGEFATTSPTGQMSALDCASQWHVAIALEREGNRNQARSKVESLLGPCKSDTALYQGWLDQHPAKAMPMTGVLVWSLAVTLVVAVMWAVVQRKRG